MRSRRREGYTIAASGWRREVGSDTVFGIHRAGVAMRVILRRCKSGAWSACRQLQRRTFPLCAGVSSVGR